MEEKKEGLQPENAGAEVVTDAETPLDKNVRLLSPGRMLLRRFFRSKLSIVGLVMLITLFAFCWVGKENVHKAFRLIPIVLCLIIAVMSVHQSNIYGMNYYYYDFVAAISAMISVFLLVSMIPDVRKQRRVKS